MTSQKYLFVPLLCTCGDRFCTTLILWYKNDIKKTPKTSKSDILGGGRGVPIIIIISVGAILGLMWSLEVIFFCFDYVM